MSSSEMMDDGYPGKTEVLRGKLARVPLRYHITAARIQLLIILYYITGIK